MKNKKVSLKSRLIHIIGTLLFLFILTVGNIFFNASPLEAESPPSSLSRTPVVSYSEHPNERMKTLRSVAPAPRRAGRIVPPSSMDAANPPQWTETLAEPDEFAQAPDPSVKPEMKVDPRRTTGARPAYLQEEPE